MSQPPTIPAALALTPENLQQIADARLRWKKIRRAISVATFDAWGAAIFAALTLLSSCMSLIAIPLGLGMAVVAYVEFRGVARLRRLDPTAARTLAYNQIFFGALLFTYAMYMLYRAYHDPGEYTKLIGSTPELNGMLGSIDDLTKLIATLIYGALAIVAVTVQGGTALYYFRREKYIRAYVAQTPSWIMQMQQVGATL